jgi:hypothetical protein
VGGSGSNNERGVVKVIELREGMTVKVVQDGPYEGWIGVIEDVNDDPNDDEPYEVYFEFCDGFAFFKAEDIVPFEEVTP